MRCLNCKKCCKFLYRCPRKANFDFRHCRFLRFVCRRRTFAGCLFTLSCLRGEKMLDCTFEERHFLQTSITVLPTEDRDEERGVRRRGFRKLSFGEFYSLSCWILNLSVHEPECDRDDNKENKDCKT